MKSVLSVKIYYTLFFIFFFCLNTTAQKRLKENLPNFKITIESSKKGIKLKSHHGSAWADLSFSTISFFPQAINKNGMTRIKEDTGQTDIDFADYLFTVTKIKNKIKLTGIKGTAWNELTFTLPLNKTITFNESGMVE